MKSFGPNKAPNKEFNATFTASLRFAVGYAHSTAKLHYAVNAR